MGRKKKEVIESDQESEHESEEKCEETNEQDHEIKFTNVPARKVFMVHEEIGKKGWENVISFCLPHPRTKEDARFLLETRLADGEDETFFVFEMLTAKEPTRSWFVDDSVVSDGNCYLGTPFDPLFLILPCLAKSTQAKPLVDHLSDHFPGKVVTVLCKRIPSQQLEHVAVKKVCDDIEAYAYSEDKTLAWLSAKVNKTAGFLCRKGINSNEASVSVNFIQSSTSPKNESDFMRYACDIVSDYIEDPLRTKLCEKLGLPTESERVKRKTDDASSGEGQNKKPRMTEDVQPLEDYSSSSNPAVANKNSKTKSKDKEFQKAAQGTHSLLKFFTPRSK